MPIGAPPGGAVERQQPAGGALREGLLGDLRRGQIEVEIGPAHGAGMVAPRAGTKRPGAGRDAGDAGAAAAPGTARIAAIAPGGTGRRPRWRASAGGCVGEPEVPFRTAQGCVTQVVGRHQDLELLALAFADDVQRQAGSASGATAGC